MSRNQNTSQLKLKLRYTHVMLGMAAIGTVAGSQNAAAQEYTLDEIIVTAQKRSEGLQEVPIAVSAFDSESLQNRGLLGGPDLEKAIPNVSFGQTGFGRYNFQIRGIGGQILGASADTGVGVHVNNIPLTFNRLAAAEMYDIERVEVLRGPQGTLYGRNATGGVINTLTAGAEDEFSAKITGELGNYNTRRFSGHVNVPLSDKLAVRAAGISINRDGTIRNEGTGNDVDDRDIWSTRLSAQWAPTNQFTARAMWEHFEQDDTAGGNRKIVCAADPGPTSIGGVNTDPLTQSFLSQGCLDVQVEDARSNGLANSLHTVPGAFGLISGAILVPPGSPPDAFDPSFVLLNGNIYAGQTINSDLHTIESVSDPLNQAKNDLFSLDLKYVLDSGLTLSSITAYSDDESLARYSTLGAVSNGKFNNTLITPGGIGNSPQLGSSDALNSMFLIDRTAKQFSQELRVQSDSDNRFNFSLGGIYMDLDVDNRVYGLDNVVPPIARGINAGVEAGGGPPNFIFVDENEIPDGSGHAYSLNNTQYELKASALFGEVYYDINDTLKATLGLRYTQDKKSQLSPPVEFLTPGRGQIDVAPQKVTFKEVTGRFTLDWQATDNSLVYGSISRGYKGGGFNPATAVSVLTPEAFEPEFVNALELGVKNSFAGGRGQLNVNGFLYDYKDYQIAKLVDQTVINENVDAEIQGLEIEASYLLTENFRLDVQAGLLNSDIGDVLSIDTSNRAQGTPGLTLVNSVDADSFAEACLVPTPEVAGLQGAINAGLAPSIAMGLLCSGPTASPNAIVGIPADLSGNDLPSAPDYTFSVGAEYYIKDSGSEWEGVLRADYYRQAESFGRIYNTESDRIKSWDNLNLSYRLISESKGLEAQIYARNLLSEDRVTNIQLNSTSTGASSVISGKERPMYGISVSKTW